MKEKKEKDMKKGNFQHGISKHTGNKEHQELKTESPLSEKDEVKQAEEKMRKNIKKGN
jgi:hypothetical protein